MITSVNLLDQNDKNKNYISKLTINQTQRIYFLFFTFKNSKLLLTRMAIMKYHMNGLWKSNITELLMLTFINKMINYIFGPIFYTIFQFSLSLFNCADLVSNFLISCQFSLCCYILYENWWYGKWLNWNFNLFSYQHKLIFYFSH